MLQGEAKTAYMREYMRRKRAGLPTAKRKLCQRQLALGETSHYADGAKLRVCSDVAHK